MRREKNYPVEHLGRKKISCPPGCQKKKISDQKSSQLKTLGDNEVNPHKTVIALDLNVIRAKRAKQHTSSCQGGASFNFTLAPPWNIK